LDSLNIKYFYNNSLPGCKYKSKSLRFDFYLPDYKTCIEYDGEQHFKPIKRFGGEDRYKISLERDNIKNIWCKENLINLIRISYKESILDKLNEAFNI
jgi:very-short-patch-repair endonuclease